MFGDPLNPHLRFRRCRSILVPTDDGSDDSLGVRLVRDVRDGMRNVEESDARARGEAEEVLGEGRAEVVLVDVDDVGERDDVRSHRGVLGMDGLLDREEEVGREVLDGDPYGVEDHHETGSRRLEVLAHFLLESGELDQTWGRRDADVGDEVDDGARRDTPTLESDDGVKSGELQVVSVVSDIPPRLDSPRIIPA